MVSAVIAGRLLEVGVAVSDLQSASGHFSHWLRAPMSAPVEERDAFGLRFTMCRVARADFEIMESLDSSGLVARFVARNGEGLHHIAFEIEDAEAAMRALRNAGVPVLGGPEPVRLANLKAFFIHPACFGGILVEFVQNLHPWLDGVAYQRDGHPPGVDARRIAGVTAVVSDVNAAIRAFCDLLGAQFLGPTVCRWIEGETRVCSVGDIELTLVQASGANKTGLRFVTVEVDDLAASSSRLLARNARLRRADSAGGTVTTVLVEHPDLHGVPIELIEPPAVLRRHA